MDNDILRFVRYFDWCALSGRLWWKTRTPEMFTYSGNYPKGSMASSWNKRWAGKEALTAVGSHGYRNGYVGGKNYLAHRVLWFLEYGWWPDMFIDHINGDRLDNRLINLRTVSISESAKNLGLRVDNKSGQHGVTWRKDNKKWNSRITVNGKVIILGDFESLDEAVSIRKQAEVKYGFHKNHGRS